MTFAFLFQTETISFAGMFICHNYNTIRRGKAILKGQHFRILRFSFDFCFLMFNFVMPIALNRSIAYNSPAKICTL